MTAAIRSEFRKLLTVRSTYFIILISLAITAFFAGFIDGIKGDLKSLSDPHLLASQSTNAVIFVGLILAFVGLLLTGHEYRYNTIMYTLTSSNRRLKVLAAKFIVITAFALLMSLLIMFFSPLCTIVAVHLRGLHIGAQTFDYWPLIGKCLFVGWGYAMYAFILIAVLRNQVGAIVSFLLIPLIGENILALLLKNNVKYLPFNALQSVAAPSSLGNHTTSGFAAKVVLVYVVLGLVVSAVLFSRRDAN